MTAKRHKQSLNNRWGGRLARLDAPRSQDPRAGAPIVQRPPKQDAPLAPAPPPDADALPQPLTFFLTAAQRRAVLRRLRRLDTDRAEALLRALRIDPHDARPKQERSANQ